VSHGDPRYLTVAGRLALLRSKLASPGALNHAMALAADAEDANDAPAEPQRSAQSAERTPKPANHPVGACSENAKPSAQNGQSHTTSGAATASATRSSDPVTRRQEAARRDFFGPVQKPKLGDVAEATLRGSSGKRALEAAS
jgi:hypothetical protein